MAAHSEIENKSQSEKPKEKVRIELEAPADELIIRKEPNETDINKPHEYEAEKAAKKAELKEIVANEVEKKRQE